MVKKPYLTKNGRMNSALYDPLFPGFYCTWQAKQGIEGSGQQINKKSDFDFAAENNVSLKQKHKNVSILGNPIDCNMRSSFCNISCIEQKQTERVCSTNNKVIRP